MDNIPDDDEIVEQQIERIIMQQMFPGYTSLHRLPKDVYREVMDAILDHKSRQTKRKLAYLKAEKADRLIK